ncbi:MAG: dioxygenase [Actinomycetota bacterium]|nr:dioxygenase [Actinomycetota bacterium]
MNKPMSPDQHLQQVLAAFDGSANPRLVEILRSAVKHLHEFTREVGLTHKEWFAGIDFLTATGQKCDDVRQEFILLSDTLGVSMLLEMINYAASANATEPTVFGPFHVDGAPHRKSGESIIDHHYDTDEHLLLSGRVKDTTGNPIVGAELDVWQVQSNGLYDVQQGATWHNMRGIYTTDEHGKFEISTVRPVDYTIPDDGPVGQMLLAAGRDKWRPAHIHTLVSANGYIPVVTHLFDSASSYLKNDVVFGVRESLIADMTNGRCTYDFVLDRV